MGVFAIVVVLLVLHSGEDGCKDVFLLFAVVIYVLYLLLCFRLYVHIFIQQLLFYELFIYIFCLMACLLISKSNCTCGFV